MGQFQFLSCTGHITSDVVKWQIPDLNWHEVDSQMRVALSIGGNDLKFSKYVKACLMELPLTDCDKTLEEINNLLFDGDGKQTLKKSLYSVWEKITANYYFRTPLI